MKKKLILILFGIFGSLSTAWANCPTDDTTLSDTHRAAAVSIRAQTEGDKSAMLLAQFVLNGCFGGLFDTNMFSQHVFNKINQARGEAHNNIVFRDEVENLFSELTSHSLEQMNQATQLETTQVWMLLLEKLNQFQMTMDSNNFDFGLSFEKLKIQASGGYDGVDIINRSCSK